MHRIEFVSNIFIFILIILGSANEINAGSSPVVLWHGMGKQNKLNILYNY